MSGVWVRGMWLQRTGAHGRRSRQRSSRVGHPDDAVGIAGTGVIVLQRPDVAAAVELELGEVVAFVEVFEHRGEDLRDFGGENQLTCVGVVVLAVEEGGEVRRGAEDVDVASKEARWRFANGDGDSGGVELPDECALGFDAEMLIEIVYLRWRRAGSCLSGILLREGQIELLGSTRSRVLSERFFRDASR